MSNHKYLYLVFFICIGFSKAFSMNFPRNSITQAWVTDGALSIALTAPDSEWGIIATRFPDGQVVALSGGAVLDNSQQAWSQLKKFYTEQSKRGLARPIFDGKTGIPLKGF